MAPINYKDCPINDLTKVVVNQIFQTYFAYGPGLFERVYEASLAGRLQALGIEVFRQKQIYITDEYVFQEPAFLADLIVENRVIIELKSVTKLQPVMHTQLRTYLNLTEIPVGILVNFNCTKLKDNIHRMMYNYSPDRHQIIS